MEERQHTAQHTLSKTTPTTNPEDNSPIALFDRCDVGADTHNNNDTPIARNTLRGIRDMDWGKTTSTTTTPITP